MLKAVSALFIPGGVVFCAALGFLRPHGLPSWTQTPISALPPIVLGFGVLFGWYVSSSRLILSLLVLALADRGLLLFPPIDPDPASMGPTVFAATAFLLPLNLLALSLVRDEALSTWRGIVRLAPILAQPFLVLWLSLPDQADLARALRQPLLPASLTAWSQVTQPALLAFLGALAMIGVRFACERNPLDAGALWALTASFTALHGLQYGWTPTNFFSAAGLILFLTLVQASHQRAYRDELTGLLGKQAYEEALAGLGAKYTVAIVGLDQLKQYGNQHGKPVSEQLLRLVAPKIQAAAGQGQVYRLAGEEITILFPRKTATDTLVTLEAIRKAVDQFEGYVRGERVWEGSRSGAETLPLTASIGVAEAGTGKSSLSLVIKAAYRALYEAKGAGGNLVRRGTVAGEIAKPPRAETGRIVAYSEFDA
jgi:diguanylate cyclase (GGDEF)-like protein